MARRVNTKFLVVFSVVVLGGVASAFILAGPVRSWYRGDRSKKLIEEADNLVKQADAADTVATKREKLESAVRDYQQALATESKNPELLVKLGDALGKLTQFDVFVYVQASRQAWDKALEIDPKYLPALRRLQDSYYQEAKIGAPTAAVFNRLYDRAKTVHDLDGTDLRSNVLMYVAPLNRWLANIETPSADIDTAIAELSTLAEKNPTAPEAPDMVFFASAAKAKKGIDAMHGGQDAQGRDLLKQSQQLFLDALKADPNSAEMHYRFFELLVYLKQSDAERDAVQHYSEQIRSELDTARGLVKPSDEIFVKVSLASHQLAVQRRDMKRAEQVLLDLRKERPSDQRVRLALAKLWRYDAVKRGMAIELLEQPMVDTGWTGVEALQKVDLEIKSLAELANMYVDRFATLPVVERPDALKQLEATYDKLYAKAHERSEVLKIRGKIELLRGGQDAPVKAIQTFEKAQAQYRVESNGREDLDLTFLLARAYFQSRQTGEAKTQLLKFKERLPDHVPVRLMLAQVYLTEGDVKGAREHVDFLEKVAPEEPDVLRLVLATLDPVKEAMKVKATYARLPEGTGVDAQGKEKSPPVVRAERMSKALVATLSPVSNPDDALRLYRLVLKDSPADFEALQGARAVLVEQGKKDEALALLKAGQAANPKDDKIALVIQQLEGASSDKLQGLSEQLIRKQYGSDPYALELKLYEFFLVAAGDLPPAERAAMKAQAFTHLQAAEKLKPDEGKVQDLMFQYYASEQNWDKAGEYVDKLAAKSWDQAKGLIYRYRLAMARGDVDGAMEFGRQLTTQLDQFARSWVFLGQAQQAKGQYDFAISTYGVALDKQSENPEAIAGIVSCYLQLNRPQEALRYIERGRTAHPSNPFFREQWKAYQMQWGDASKVIQPAIEDRDANPKDPSRWLNLGRAQYAAARKGDEKSAKYLADAKATFAEALRQWPGERAFWAYQAELADFAKDEAGAERVLKDMVARAEFKESPEPTMMLADHYLRHGKADVAEATMKQAVATFPASGEVKRRLAAYYTQNKRYDDALRLLDPSSPDRLVRQQIVEVYMLAGRFGDAEKLLRGLLSADDKDAQLHALLGVVLLNENKEEQATESLTTALTLDPKNQAALYSRGQLRLKAKAPQVDGAISDLVALRDVNKGHIEGRVALAEAFRAQQRNDEAMRELEDVLRMAPNRRDVRLNLIGLYASAKNPAWTEAERLVADAEKAEPTEVMWKRMQAKMYSTRGMHEKAALKIRDAMGAAPQNGELVRDYLDILEAGKFWQQLLADTDRALTGDKAAADKAWWLYVKRAVARRNLDQSKEAMADFMRAMDIVQGDKELSQDILIAIVDKIRTTLGPDKSIERVMMLAAAAKAGPEQTRWKVVLAYLYVQAGDAPRALTLIEEVKPQFATLDDRNAATALSIAGNIYMLSERYDLAKAAYEQLLSKRADDVGALNNLACVVAEHAEPPNVDLALKYSQRAIDAMAKRGAAQQDAAVLDTYGWMNVLAGGANVDRGVEYLNNSLKAGEIPEAHYHLGEAFLRKQWPEQAKSSLARASTMIDERLAKQPEDASLKQLRLKVEQSSAKVEKALLEPRAGAR